MHYHLHKIFVGLGKCDHEELVGADQLFVGYPIYNMLSYEWSMMKYYAMPLRREDLLIVSHSVTRAWLALFNHGHHMGTCCNVCLI
jgi:hypothetical protein